MKLEISLFNDDELRGTIKDMIKGAVKTIQREELKEIAVAATKEVHFSEYVLKRSLNDAAKLACDEAIKKLDISGRVDKKLNEIIEVLKVNMESALLQKAKDLLSEDLLRMAVDSIADKVVRTKVSVVMQKGDDC